MVVLTAVVLCPLRAPGQEGILLTEEQAPRAVFPDAGAFERRVIPATEELTETIRRRMGKTKTSLWENSYVTFVAKNGDVVLGYAAIVEEIGKHRPLTFIVGVGKDRRVKDVALMIYREPYGGEVKDRRFLSQYQGKDMTDPLLPYRDIQNITGATLSVEAIGRGTKKALALLDILYPEGNRKK